MHRASSLTRAAPLPTSLSDSSEAFNEAEVLERGDFGFSFGAPQKDTVKFSIRKPNASLQATSPVRKPTSKFDAIDMAAKGPLQPAISPLVAGTDPFTRIDKKTESPGRPEPFEEAGQNKPESPVTKMLSQKISQNKDRSPFNFDDHSTSWMPEAVQRDLHALRLNPAGAFALGQVYSPSLSKKQTIKVITKLARLLRETGVVEEPRVSEQPRSPNAAAKSPATKRKPSPRLAVSVEQLQKKLAAASEARMKQMLDSLKPDAKDKYESWPELYSKPAGHHPKEFILNPDNFVTAKGVTVAPGKDLADTMANGVVGIRKTVFR